MVHTSVKSIQGVFQLIGTYSSRTATTLAIHYLGMQYKMQTDNIVAYQDDQTWKPYTYTQAIKHGCRSRARCVSNDSSSAVFKPDMIVSALSSSVVCLWPADRLRLSFLWLRSLWSDAVSWHCAVFLSASVAKVANFRLILSNSIWCNWTILLRNS